VEPLRRNAFDDPPNNAKISRHLPLLALIDVAKELGSQRIEREARALADRVADKRFFVACLGQFKRGKSSLLNALVSTPVLPTAVVPVTAIVTILRHGPILHAEVHFDNGSRQHVPVESISEYVSEERNPANFRGVAAVEVFVPGALLASGVCLVDTPGIGSVFAANTAVTKAFVPHIDAALVVLGADPPISGEELALLEQIAAHVSEMVFVLSKTDRLTTKECNEAIEFARRTLAQKIRRDVGHVFQVSAAEWLNGAGPLRDAPLLQAELERIARESGPALVEAAERRGIERLSAALVREIDNQRNALIAPSEESQRIAERLRETIADAERSLGDLSHLFKAEQERVSHKCSERRDRFLSEAIPAARKEFHDALIGTKARGGTLRDQATTLAQRISQPLLDRWLTEERPAAEVMYRESAQRFVDMANGFLKRMADSGDPALANLPETVGSDSGFRVKGRLYYGQHFGFPRETFTGWLQNLFRSRAYQIQRVERRVVRYLDTLLSLNSTRILNDFDGIVRESARRLEAEIRGLLKDLQSVAGRRLEHAQATRAAGAEAVRVELARIEALRHRTLDLVDGQ